MIPALVLMALSLATISAGSFVAYRFLDNKIVKLELQLANEQATKRGLEQRLHVLELRVVAVEFAADRAAAIVHFVSPGMRAIGLTPDGRCVLVEIRPE